MRATYIFNLILKYLIINLCFVFLITNCSRKNLWTTFDNSYSERIGAGEGSEPMQSVNNVTRFDFLKSDNAGLTSDVSGYIDSSTIDLSVPQGFDISALVPYIMIDGKTVTPADGIQKDFSGGPVDYTVTAEDNSQKVYSVIVDNGPPAAPGAPPDTVITSPMQINFTGGDESDFKEFRFTLTGTPPGNCSEGVPAQASTPIDIPLMTTTIHVIACDNFGYASDLTTRVYSYNSTGVKDIVQFDFRNSDNPGFNFKSDVVGVINESTSTIDLVVPSGTNINNLVPYIIHTGKVVSPGSGVAKDFSAGILYEVTAEDSSIKKYFVKVHVPIINLAQNGSFEMAFPLLWYSSNPGSYVRSNFESVESNHSISLLNDGIDKIDPLKQDITISPNADYILTFSMKLSSDTVSGEVVFDTSDVFDDLCQVSLSASNKGEWKNYSCTFNSGTRSFIKLRFFQSEESMLKGTAYLDNVILSKIK